MASNLAEAIKKLYEREPKLKQKLEIKMKEY